VALQAERLSSLPPGTPTAFEWVPRPQAVALDLAIQAAGLVSVPVTDPAEAPGRGARRWAKDIKDEKDSKDGKDLPEAGGVVVAGPRVVSQEEMVAAAERIQETAGSGREREIVVIGRSPELWIDRVFLAWATLYGAAILLASDPSSLVGSAVWARPTLFHGTAAEIAALRRAVEQERPPFWDRKRDRLPFGRLRTVLWSGGGPPEEERRFWEGRGVRIAPLLS